MTFTPVTPPTVPKSDFNPFNPFYLLTGVTLFTFGSGFGACLFNLDTVDECVAVANSWVETFQAVGDHLICWAFHMYYAAFDKTLPSDIAVCVTYI